MPSVNSSSIPKVWDSSTVMTPSLPTLSIASAMVLPISASCAEMAATEAISSLVSRSRAWSRMYSATASTARSMPRLSPSGLAPAATLRSPSCTSACASTVAVVVPSPATSLAIVTPSLVMVGAPHFLSSTTLRPLGPSVTRTTLASLSTPASSARRASTSKSNSFGIWVSPDLLVDDGEHVAGGEDQVVLAAVLDLGAAVLGVNDGVADLDVERHPGAVLEPARADRDDLALLGLFLGGVRDDDAGGGRLLALTGLDDDAVLERLQIDAHRSSCTWSDPPSIGSRTGGAGWFKSLARKAYPSPRRMLALAAAEC